MGTLTNTPSYFITKTFEESLREGKSKKPRKKILGDFLYEGTNTLLFSNRNYGKSMLAFQIAVNAATGRNFSDESCLVNECSPSKVLLFDLEMDDQTLADRHANAWDNYDRKLLNENFIIVRDNPDVNVAQGSSLLALIEQKIKEHQPRLVIIDNLTKLCPDLLDVKMVTGMIEVFKRLNQKYQTSFLAIGHTIKNLTTVALTESSYYGSSHIANFFTEVFYIDKVKNATQEYFLRHAKSKHAIQWTETVATMHLGSHPKDGLGFTFLNLHALSDVQMPLTIEVKGRKPLKENYTVIKAARDGGASFTDIAKSFDVSKQAISKLLN